MLSPSERINLIQEIARRMDDKEWALIDLVLNQFGLQTYNRWEGTKEEYLHDILKEASDASLEGIAEHVGYSFRTPQRAIEAVFWKPRHFRLFVSHLAIHKEYAGKLQSDLAEYQVSAFVAHEDIQPAKEWLVEIESALRTCDALVAVMTPGFHESVWTDQEVGFVLGRDVLVIPVDQGVAPYGFMGKNQAMNARDWPARSLADELFDVLVANKQTQVAMAEALVARVEDSDSFKDAMRNVDLLDRLGYWNDNLARRVETAAKTNSQLANAYTVPRDVEKLMKKWRVQG